MFWVKIIGTIVAVMVIIALVFIWLKDDKAEEVKEYTNPKTNDPFYVATTGNVGFNPDKNATNPFGAAGQSGNPFSNY